MIVSLVDFLISLAILGVIMVWYQFIPGWRILSLPLFLLIALMAAFGFGIWFSSLNVKYRDFRYIVPFLAQLGLYLSPVGFSSSIIPEKWRLVYSINPMVGVIDGFRWAVLAGEAEIYVPGFAISTVIILILLYFGSVYFKKAERTFADVI